MYTCIQVSCFSRLCVHITYEFYKKYISINAFVVHGCRKHPSRQKQPGNLVLRQLIFNTFNRILKALRVEWRNLTPRFAFLRHSEEIKMT